jgi:crotonobetainyl-CoA:carnitine CoA-transferase CaiB-like acyl-CoA transferase
MSENTAPPLARFTIVELNDAGMPMPLRLAASLAGKIAADLGATVLKLEPPGGDPVRRLPPFLPQGESALFLFLNTSKRSLPLDPALLPELLAKADVCLFEESSPSADLVRKSNATPVEIAALASGMAPMPFSEFIVLAMGGLLHMVGEPDRKPLRLGGHQASYAAGFAAFTGLASALAARSVGGTPPTVRVSLTEVMQWVNWKAASGADASGKSPGREGKRSEFQIVRCRDGYVAVVYTATQWPATRALIGDKRLEAKRFATRAGRRENVAEIYDILRPWFSDKTRAEIQSMAQAKGVPFGPIYSPAELLKTEQYVARGFLATLGDWRIPQLPVQWNGRTFAPKIAPSLAVSSSETPGQSRVTEEAVALSGAKRNRGALPLQIGGNLLREGPSARPFGAWSGQWEASNPSHANAPPEAREGNKRPLAGIRVLDFGLLTAGANTSAMLADLGADVLKIESGAYLDPFRVVGKMDDEHGWWNRSPQFRFTNRNKRGLAINLKNSQGQKVIRELAGHCDVVVENFRRGVLDRAGLGYADLAKVNPRIVFAAISSQGDTGPERMNVSFGSTLDATSGIASLTGYEDEEPRISGMDVNYPDQIVSLFASGIVIAAVMEARCTGCGCFLDFSQREVASFTLGEEIVVASANAGRQFAPRGNRDDTMALQDTFRCRDGRWIAVSSSAIDPTIEQTCSDNDHLAAIAVLRARGIATALCNDGNDLLRDTALAGVTLARDADGSLVKGLPYRLNGAGFSIERPAPDLGQHTDEVLRSLLGYDDAQLKELSEAGVTSITPSVGEV